MSLRPVAALFVHRGGAYYGLDDVDPWDEERDARTYAGPHPVVAHPPCTRWCQLAGLVEARYGYRVGDDDGCFEAALRAVRTWGGVLEHPAYSKAWPRFYLARPRTCGGWTDPDRFGGQSCHVEQRAYGHPARKATWLYMVGAPNSEPPALRWGRSTAPAEVLVSWCGNRDFAGKDRKRIGKKQAAATPAAFRDELLRLARLTNEVRV